MSVIQQSTKVVFLDIDGVIATSEALGMKLSNYYGVAFPQKDFVKKVLEAEKKSSLPYLQRSGNNYPFSLEAMENIYELKDKTNCEFVMSSCWRQGRGVDEINNLMKKKDFQINFIGKTPYIGMVRGKEISDWLLENPVDKYIIIDDESYDILPYHPSNLLIKTDCEIGFSKADLKKAIDVLMYEN